MKPRFGPSPSRPAPQPPLEELLPAELRACFVFHHRARAALQFGMRDAARHVALRDVADHVGMETTAFCRYFKLKIGKPYAITVRIVHARYAASLLRANDYSVAEVAALAGYDNRSTFNRSFRLHYGLSPYEYRLRNEPLPHSESLPLT